MAAFIVDAITVPVYNVPDPAPGLNAKLEFTTPRVLPVVEILLSCG